MIRIVEAASRYMVFDDGKARHVVFYDAKTSLSERIRLFFGMRWIC